MKRHKTTKYKYDLSKFQKQRFPIKLKLVTLQDSRYDSKMTAGTYDAWYCCRPSTHRQQHHTPYCKSLESGLMSVTGTADINHNESRLNFTGVLRACWTRRTSGLSSVSVGACATRDSSVKIPASVKAASPPPPPFLP